MIEWTAEEQKDAWGKLYERFDELPVPEKRVWEVQAELTRAEGQRDALISIVERFVQIAPACMDAGGVAINRIVPGARAAISKAQEGQ